MYAAVRVDSAVDGLDEGGLVLPGREEESHQLYSLWVLCIQDVFVLNLARTQS